MPEGVNPATGELVTYEEKRVKDQDLRTQVDGLLNTRIEGVENPETDAFFLREGEDPTQVIKAAGKLGLDVSDKAHKVLDELLGSEEIARLLELTEAEGEIFYKGQKVKLECIKSDENENILMVGLTFIDRKGE